MTMLLIFIIAAALAAGQTAPGQQPTPQEAKPELQPAAEQVPSPAPTAEQWLTGTVDFGYRWLADVRGDFNTYRSVVNLGEGPKLLGLDWTIQDPSHRLFDRIDVRAHAWGGDPYNTARIDARRERLYQFTFDYRNLAYFNFLPSFANPGLREPGVVGGAPFSLSERTYDTIRRTSSFDLDMFPARRIVPFLGYTRNSGTGSGTTVFVEQGNEYPVFNRLRDHTDDYRGGVRLEFNRIHLTLEQGGTTFKDDQEVRESGPNPGNVTTPVLGQRLVLNDLLQAYGVRGDSLYSRALVTANPVSWADVYAQFLYSRPRVDVNYSEDALGNFVLFRALRFYNSQHDLASAEASQPHTSGSVSVELRPVPRLRVIESWSTDRLHVGSSAFLTEQILLTGGALAPETLALANRLVWNYNRQQVDALFDIEPWLIVRGGHRYEWGNAEVGPGLVSPSRLEQNGELRRHVGLAGVSVRRGQKIGASVDFEASPGDRSYFRTSLHDYRKARIQARYQALPSLQLGANFSVLNNRNPAPEIDYDFLSRQNSVSVFFTPAGGRRISVLAEYGRMTLRSDISYLNPTFPSPRAPELSRYRERAHIGSALVEINLPGSGVVQPKLSFGGSFYVNSDNSSRPARYHQPIARFALPLHRRVQWNSEWRWFGLSQPSRFIFEGFRSHQFITGFRLSM